MLEQPYRTEAQDEHATQTNKRQHHSYNLRVHSKTLTQHSFPTNTRYESPYDAGSLLTTQDRR